MQRERAWPRVAVVCDRDGDGPLAWQRVGEKYLQALWLWAEVLPIPLPALDWSAEALEAWLADIDGVLLTGAHSNVAPHWYGATGVPVPPQDVARDRLSFAVIAWARTQDRPLLGICRGLQELNVAWGGTLQAQLASTPITHREHPDWPLARRYGPVHLVQLQAGGLLAGLSETSEVMVNSLHGQGIEQLAPGLRVEAVAADGVIEAVAAPAQHFMLAVQWHPEWMAAELPLDQRLFQAFGRACRVKSEQGV